MIVGPSFLPPVTSVISLGLLYLKFPTALRSVVGVISSSTAGVSVY